MVLSTQLVLSSFSALLASACCPATPPPKSAAPGLRSTLVSRGRRPVSPEDNCPEAFQQPEFLWAEQDHLLAPKPIMARGMKPQILFRIRQSCWNSIGGREMTEEDRCHEWPAAARLGARGVSRPPRAWFHCSKRLLSTSPKLN